MIEATNLKNGSTFKMDGQPFKVIKYTHQKIGRGGANVVLSVRNLKTGDPAEKTMSSNAKVEEIETKKTQLQFLYKDSDFAYFMEPQTYEQIQIPLKVIGDEVLYIKAGENADILFWSFGGAQDKDDQPLSIEIPPKVVLKVDKTAPGVKGNSATNVFKSAVLENGLTVKIPLFNNEGEMVVVDTRTGGYVERAKK